jgi:hypothetical protein
MAMSAAPSSSLTKPRAGGLVISADSVLTRGMEQLATLTVRRSLPAVAFYREFAAAGGLARYGGALGESYRPAGP